MSANNHEIKFPDDEEDVKENFVWKHVKIATKKFFYPLTWMWHKVRLPPFPKMAAQMHEFEEWDKMLKEKYPIRWILFDRMPWHISMFWKWQITDRWYQLKCYVWHRHNTIEAKTLKRTYCDIPELMLHVNFQMIVRYVEEEKCFEHIEWEGNGPAFSSVAKEIRELYKWWTVDRPIREEAIWEGNDEREKVSLGDLLHGDDDVQAKPAVIAAREFYAEIRRKEAAATIEDDCQLIRLMKIRHYLWT